MNKVNLNIWGRNFNLVAVFQNYPGEEILEEQEDVMSKIPQAEIQDSLPALKRFIVKNNSSELAEDQEISNVFKYIAPQRILISRDDANWSFAIMCKYKFDLEHGIALTFFNNIFKTVCFQDEIL